MTFLADESFRCIRDGNDVTIKPANEPLAPNEEVLAKFVFQNGFWFITYEPAAPVVKKFYQVVNDLPNRTYNLAEKDVIKLGRFRLRIKQLKLQPPYTRDQVKFEDNPVVLYQPESPEKLQCRICLLDGSSEDNEDILIQPCNCRGSIQYVHVGCLQHWFSARASTTSQHGETGSFFYKQASCELCHATMPFQIRVAPTGETASTYSEERAARELPTQLLAPCVDPEHPFAVLECIYSQAVHKGVHVLTLPPQRFEHNSNSTSSVLPPEVLRLGRGHESDVRIPDVSISRVHAGISLSEDGKRVILTDNNSKFGTLVHLRPHMIPANGVPVSIQIGRSHLNIRVAPVESELVKEALGNQFKIENWNGGILQKKTHQDGEEEEKKNIPPLLIQSEPQRQQEEQMEEGNNDSSNNDDNSGQQGEEEEGGGSGAAAVE